LEWPCIPKPELAAIFRGFHKNSIQRKIRRAERERLTYAEGRSEALLEKFGGIHRENEILMPSGIFWTLLGCWLTMVIFTNKRIVLPALGFLVFGDTLAALGGQKWGKRPWVKNPAKTLEGSACFAAISALWALLFVRWPVAILGALSGAWECGNRASDRIGMPNEHISNRTRQHPVPGDSRGVGHVGRTSHR